MALEETAHLVAELDLRNNMHGAAAEATADVEKMDTATAAASTRMAGLSRLTTGASGALTHFKDRMHETAKIVGAAGLLGGGFALLEGIKSSVEQTLELGTTITRLTQVSGMNATQASTLTAVWEHFGIQTDATQRIVGFLTKTIGNQTATAKSAKAFQDKYGFSLLDASGKAKKASQVIADSVDFYNNKSIPATQRAAAMAALYGRSWQTILPYLAAGKKGVADVTDEVTKAGSVIDEKGLASVTQYREALQNFGTATTGLKTQIGLAVIPVLTELADTMTGWLENGGTQQLTQWFKGAINFGKQLAGVFMNTVLPAAKSIIGVGQAIWNSLPPPMKDLLVQGIVADKTIKFLFGIDLGKVATGAIGDAVGGGLRTLVSNLMGRGSPANPMFVVAEGGLGGAGGIAESGGGGLVGKVAILGAVALAATSIYLLAQQFGTFMQTTQQAQNDLQQKDDEAARQTATDALNNLKNLNTKLSGLQGFDRILADTFGGKQEAEGLQNLADAITNNGHLTSAQITDAITTLQAAQVQAQARGATTVADHIGTDIATLQARLSGQGATQNDLLGTIAAQPTTVNVTTNTTVSANISTRDASSAFHTSSRYGMQAV